MSISSISFLTNAMQTSNRRQAGHSSNSFLTQAAQIVQGDHSPEERKALFQQLTLVQQGKDLELLQPVVQLHVHRVNSNPLQMETCTDHTNFCVDSIEPLLIIHGHKSVSRATDVHWERQRMLYAVLKHNPGPLQIHSNKQ